MVRSFQDYLKLKKENSAYDVGKDVVGNNSLSTQEEQSLSKLFNIMKLAWSRYKGDVKSFLDRMASQDSDIKQLVDELNDNYSALGNATGKMDQPDDDYMVPSADMEDGDMEEN